jgi:hypothetical protein
VKATYLPLADANGNITGLIDKATNWVVVAPKQRSLSARF